MNHHTTLSTFAIELKNFSLLDFFTNIITNLQPRRFICICEKSEYSSLWNLKNVWGYITWKQNELSKLAEIFGFIFEQVRKKMRIEWQGDHKLYI